MKYVCNYVYLKGIKNNKNMFPLCQTYKPTEARGLTSRMSSFATTVRLVIIIDDITLIMTSL